MLRINNFRAIDPRMSGPQIGDHPGTVETRRLSKAMPLRVGIQYFLNLLLLMFIIPASIELRPASSPGRQMFVPDARAQAGGS